MKLIIGLGNPGRKYEDTKHNIGFKVIDILADKLNIKINKKECFSIVGERKEVVLAKPQTFMNLSGESVVCLCKKYNLKSNDLILIYDDLDLPLGEIRIRQRGSSGGHKGVESVINKLNTGEFIRVRIGIRGKVKPKDAVNFVLSEFDKNERKIIQESILKAVEAIIFLKDNNNIELTMNRFN
ncbi:MAG: aminoacyl-tRNA hydrolase [Candidatus Firestonebacteria bacterium]